MRHRVIPEVRRVLHLGRIRRVEDLGAGDGGDSQHGDENRRERPEKADWQHGVLLGKWSCESPAL